MISARDKVVAWLELLRISNAPTVVSNVIAGLAIGAHAGVARIAPLTAMLLAVGSVLLYSAGMILNDVLDVELDRAERPARPIPSGRIARASAWAVAAIMVLVGVAAIAPAGRRPLQGAAVLVVAIVIYNLIHRRTAGSVLVMGLCRGLLYAIAIASSVAFTDHARLILPVALLGGYTAAFSVVARHETAMRPEAQRLLAWLPLPLGLAIVVAVAPPWRELFALIPAPALIITAVWATRRPPRLRPAILLWIASFCLIDAAVCAAVGRFDLAGVCIACWLVTTWSHGRILGT